MNIPQKVLAARLVVEDAERLEDRVSPILREARRSLGEGPWQIHYIDAIGRLAGSAASQWERDRALSLRTTELIQIFAEEGQIIEFNATIGNDQSALVRIIIRDGFSVRVLVVGDVLDLRVLGEFTEVDPEDLGWPPEECEC